MSVLARAANLVTLTMYRIQERYRQHPMCGIHRASPMALQRCDRCTHAGYGPGRTFQQCRATNLIVHRDDVCKRFTVGAWGASKMAERGEE